MFEHLKCFDHILVSGPQRSGTTICGKMVAKDTGFKYIDEFEIKLFNLDKLRAIFAAGVGNVIQCPALCRNLHEIADDRIAVVFMRREIKDIIASQERIKWSCEKGELIRYRKDERGGSEIISEVKYHFWDTVQKSRIPHAFEVQYESLASHPMWVDKDLRKNFNAKQTSPDDTMAKYGKPASFYIPNYQI
jgi:hypothetical protein